MSRGRRGLTLLELLVAMSILLVGIYAVAAGFPALFGTLEHERIRTEMTRRVEARMERLQTAPGQVPEAITGHDPADGSVIPPALYPDEGLTPVPGNPRDDLLWVLGETFRVPIAQVRGDGGQDYSVYPLTVGPAIPDGLEVLEVERLRRVDTDLLLDVSAASTDFQLDSDGYLYAPTRFRWARVDYVWVDSNGHQHGVVGEIVDNANYPPNTAPAPVRATRVDVPAEFVNVLPEAARAEGLREFTVEVGGDAAPGYAILDEVYGTTLRFAPEDAHRILEVSYQLKTVPYQFADEVGDIVTWQRRAPIMIEEMSAPTERPFAVDLAFRGIDDEFPLYTEDVLGNALPGPVYVLVVDLSDGSAWTDAEDWIGIDFVESRLTLDWDHASAPMNAVQARGHDLRIYYRTLNDHTIMVQRAPETFVEDVHDPGDSFTSLYDTYVEDGLAEAVDYRYYTVYDPSVWGDTDHPSYPNHVSLRFPPSVAGKMVMVDYIVLDSSGTSIVTVERIDGELHTIPSETLEITLRQPKFSPGDQIAILAVRGVSLTVRGWWYDGRGRVQMVGVDSFLAPEPLL